MKTPEPSETRLLTVRIRRGPDRNVRPAAEVLDGKTFLFQAAWRIEDDDSRYHGEWAWMFADGADDPGVGWIASGDLAEPTDPQKAR